MQIYAIIFIEGATRKAACFSRKGDVRLEETTKGDAGGTSFEQM